MTDDNIEQKALAIVNEIEREEGTTELTPHIMRADLTMDEALCRAIEQREAFKQEVSDEVHDYHQAGRPEIYFGFDRFIIPKPKPDPLAEVMEELNWAEGFAVPFRKAMEALGLEITEKNDD